MPDLDVPPVPPVWNWIGLAFAFMSTVAAIAWLWQRFVADWWAARSKENAIGRAREVATWASEVEILRKDTPRLIATCAVCVLWVLVGIGFFLATLVSFADLTTINNALPVVLMVGFYVFILFGGVSFIKLVRPIANIISYRVKTVRRITRLLAKADFSNEEKAEFFKEFVEEFRREHNGGEQ